MRPAMDFRHPIVLGDPQRSVLSAIPVALAQTAAPVSAQRFYQKRCAACHVTGERRQRATLCRKFQPCASCGRWISDWDDGLLLPMKRKNARL